MTTPAPRILLHAPHTEYFFQEGCFITELSNGEHDPEVSLAKARVEAGKTTAWHALEGITERYLILNGIGRMEVGDLAPQEVGPGDVILVPPRCRQRITNLGPDDLIFLVICSPRFQPNKYIER